MQAGRHRRHRLQILPSHRKGSGGIRDRINHIDRNGGTEWVDVVLPVPSSNVLLGYIYLSDVVSPEHHCGQLLV